MGIILSKSKKVFIVIILTILISNIMLPVLAATYTSSLKVGDKLKFTGNSWYVYTSKTAAQNLDKTKTTTNLEKNDTITIQEKSGNVLKIGNSKYIYYGSTASSNFTLISSNNSGSSNSNTNTSSNNKPNKSNNNNYNGFNIFSFIEPVIDIIVSIFDSIFSSTPKDIEVPEIELPEIKLPEINIPKPNNNISNAFNGLSDIITGSTSEKPNIFDPIKSENEEIKQATSISLPTFTTELKVGEEKTLSLSYSPSSANKPNVTFTSGKTSVVTVNNNGTVKGIGPGETNIIAKTDTGLEASCKIKVLPPVATSINIESSEYKLNNGSSLNLKYTVTPSNIDKSDLTWTSSNNEYVTVSNGKITAKKVTSSPVTITVQTKNGLKDTCKVTVISTPTKKYAEGSYNSSCYKEFKSYRTSWESKAKYVYNQLINAGATPEGAAGAIGNITQECRWNITLTNSSGHYGMVQWGGGRKTNLQKNKDYHTLAVQTSFMIKELKNSYSSVWNTLKTTKDVITASDTFQDKYEVCGGQRSNRREFSIDWYNYFTGLTKY